MSVDSAAIVLPVPDGPAFVVDSFPKARWTLEPLSQKFRKTLLSRSEDDLWRQGLAEWDRETVDRVYSRGYHVKAL